MRLATLILLMLAAPCWADYYTLRVLNRSGRPYEAYELEFTPDGEQLVFSSGKGVMVVAVDGCRVQHEDKTAAHTMAFTRDSGQLLMVSRSATRMMNLKTGDVVNIRWRLVPGKIGVTLEENGGKILVKAVSEGGPVAKAGIKPGDEIVAVQEFGVRNSVLGRGVSKTVGYFEGPAGTPVTLYVIPRGKRKEKRLDLTRRRGEVNGDTVRFLPERSRRDGAPLAAFSSDNYRVCLDAASGEVNSIIAPEKVGSGMWDVTPDGNRFVTVGKRRQRGETQFMVEVFDVNTRKKLFEIPYNDSYGDIRFTEDSRNALIGSHDSVYVLDLESEEFSRQLNLGWKPTVRVESSEEEGHEGPTGWWFKEAKGRSPKPLLTSYDICGELLAVGGPDGRLTIWSTETGEMIREVIPSPPDGQKGKPIQQTCLSPDAEWLAYYSNGVLTLETVEESEE